MKEYHTTENVTVSAMKADMSRPTARKYLEAQQPPEQLQGKHTWRTRPDPLEKVWPEAEGMLKEAPELEAKALFEHLRGKYPWHLKPEHLRTFQRRLQQWRLTHGPDKEVFFPQDWKPGQALQMDWTNANELQVTICGQPYAHLLCHGVLPYSNWDWATCCRSESFLSLRHGLQESLHRLGRVPEELRLDNGSAATHQIVGTGQRRFNAQLVSLCEHYGLEPQRIGIGCPNENGDVESSNRHLKRRVRQHLLLRGSRDFENEAQYQTLLGEVLKGGNDLRQERLKEELAVMKALPPTRLTEYDEVDCRVSRDSTIRVKKVGYSVPARLIGQRLKVEVYEDQLKAYVGRELMVTLPRCTGDRGVALDYRHVIDHLLRKPGAFERYRYRAELYPSTLFREAYDRLVKDHGPRAGTLEYLRLLKLASEVKEEALELLLIDHVCGGAKWQTQDLRQALLPRRPVNVDLAELQPDCRCYDGLLSANSEVSHGC